jgi:hypothetical protein
MDFTSLLMVVGGRLFGFADCPVIIDFVVNWTFCETIWQEKERGCCFFCWSLQTRKVRLSHIKLVDACKLASLCHAMPCVLIANSVLAHFVFLILCEWWAWRITKETWTWWTQTGYLPFLRQSSIAVCFFSTGSNRPWSARNNSANLAIKC